MKEIQKIAIIGGPGTGKSTLAKNLGKEMKLPVYHIDGIHHLKNWEIRPTQERDSIISEKVKEPKWVIDGTYKATLEERVINADLIIFLDYSTIAKLKGILSRYFKNKGQEKPEIPGCKEKMDWKFIQLTIKWNKTKRKIVKDILDRYKDKKILIFKNRRSLNKWYENKFKKGIEL